ncbi:hypothetical protein MRX96_012737 [Rhipicephalus microplus]
MTTDSVTRKDVMESARHILLLLEVLPHAGCYDKRYDKRSEAHNGPASVYQPGAAVGAALKARHRLLADLVSVEWTTGSIPLRSIGCFVAFMCNWSPNRGARVYPVQSVHQKVDLLDRRVADLGSDAVCQQQLPSAATGLLLPLLFLDLSGLRVPGLAIRAGFSEYQNQKATFVLDQDHAQPSEPSWSSTLSSRTKDETSGLVQEYAKFNKEEGKHLFDAKYVELMSIVQDSSLLVRWPEDLCPWWLPLPAPSPTLVFPGRSRAASDYAKKDAAVTFRIYLAAVVGALSVTILVISVLTTGPPIVGEQRGRATERITARTTTTSPTVRTTADRAEMETIGNIKFLDLSAKKRRRSWARATRSSPATPKTRRVPYRRGGTRRRLSGRNAFVQTLKTSTTAGTTAIRPRANVGDGHGRSDEARRNKHRPVPRIDAGPKILTEATSHPRPSSIKNSVPAVASKSPRPTAFGKPPPQAKPDRTSPPTVPGGLPPPNVHGKSPPPTGVGKSVPPAVAGEPSTVSRKPPHTATAGKPAVAHRPPHPATVGKLPIPVPTERPHHREREQTKAAVSEAKPQPKPSATTTPGGTSGIVTDRSVAAVGSGGAGGRYVVENKQTPGPVVETSSEEEDEYEDDDGMSFEEGLMPPRLSGRGDEEGDHGVGHGHETALKPTPPPGDKAPPYVANVTHDAVTSTSRKMQTSGDYDDDKPGIVGGVKRDKSLQWDKRKALLLCTVGSTLTDEAVYPVKERLCDHYVFTHVTVLGSELGTNYGISAYMTFRKVRVVTARKFASESIVANSTA